MTIKFTKVQESMITTLQTFAPEKVQAYIESLSMPKVRAKMAVEAKIHTGKDSGKLSIAIGQGRRVAYMNAAQLEFILDNAESIKQMITKL